MHFSLPGTYGGLKLTFVGVRLCGGKLHQHQLGRPAGLLVSNRQ